MSTSQGKSTVDLNQSTLLHEALRFFDFRNVGGIDALRVPSFEKALGLPPRDASDVTFGGKRGRLEPSDLDGFVHDAVSAVFAELRKVWDYAEPDGCVPLEACVFTL